MKISVIIPLYNEQESLEPLTEKISEALSEPGGSYEVIFINDGSTDDSMNILRRLHEQDPDRIKVYAFGRNYGKSAALSAGIDKAEGDIIVTMDADLQDDPGFIPEMRDKIINEKWDVVSGWKKKRHDPVTKTIPSKLFNLVTGLLSGLRLHDFNCGFKAYTAQAARSLEIYGERHRYLPVMAKWNGYSVTEIPVTHHPRKYGKTKFGINRFWNGLFDLITLVFLRKYMANPLHFFGIIGLLSGLAGTGILAYFGYKWAVTGHLHIRPLILFAVTGIILGIQFISLGLIGEMITGTSSSKRYSIKESLE